jgi:hypothetical protein
MQPTEACRRQARERESKGNLLLVTNRLKRLKIPNVVDVEEKMLSHD